MKEKYQVIWLCHLLNKKGATIVVWAYQTLEGMKKDFRTGVVSWKDCDDVSFGYINGELTYEAARARLGN